MKTPAVEERGLVNEILRAADRRAEEIVRANLPAIRYGIVDAIDAANRKATVQLPGPGSSSPGFVYPPRLDRLQIGERVRVVLLPTGDRYIDEGVSGPAEGGTVFPSAPFVGQRYFRTDARMEWIWDGTRWLCTCPHVLSMSRPDLAWSAGDNKIGRVPHPGHQFGWSVWVEWVEWTGYVIGTTDASNYWQARFWYIDGATATLHPTAPGMGAGGTGQRTITQAYNSIFGTDVDAFELTWNEVGSPGTLHDVGGVIVYRFAI